MGANDDRDRRALSRHRGGGHAQRRQGISQRRDVLRRRRQGQAPPLRAAGAGLRPDQPSGRRSPPPISRGPARRSASTAARATTLPAARSAMSGASATARARTARRRSTTTRSRAASRHRSRRPTPRRSSATAPWSASWSSSRSRRSRSPTSACWWPRARHVAFDGTPSTASKWTIAQDYWDFGDGTKISGAKVDSRLRQARRLRGDPHGGRRFRPPLQHRDRKVLRPRQRAAGRRSGSGPARLGQPGSRLRCGRKHRLRRQDRRLSVGLRRRQQGLRRQGHPQIRQGRHLQGDARHPRRFRRAQQRRRRQPRRSSSTIRRFPRPAPTRSGAIGEPLTFDASGSVDRDGRIIAYDWDFGDGSKATGVKVTHAYAKSGTYTVKLTVTDDSTTDTSAVERHALRARQRAAGRQGRPRPARHREPRPVRRLRLGRPGRQHRQIRMGFRRRRHRHRPEADPRLHQARHLHRAPDGHRRVRARSGAAPATIRRSSSTPCRSPMPAPISSALPARGSSSAGRARSIRTARSPTTTGTSATARPGSGQTVKHAFAKSGTYKVRLKVQDNTEAGRGGRLRRGRGLRQPAAGRRRRAGRRSPRRDRRSTCRRRTPTTPTARSRATAGTSAIRASPPTRPRSSGPSPSPASTRPSSRSPTTAAPTTRIATDSVKIAINHAPVADAGPDIVSSGTTITFDGTRSVDADGDALAYSWDFGDGADRHRADRHPHLCRGRHLSGGPHRQ